MVKPLLEAVDALRGDCAARSTDFLRPNSKWSRRLRIQPDRRHWETAVLFHLRDAFRSGDVWLARSRRYGDIRNALLSTRAVTDPTWNTAGLASNVPGAARPVRSFEQPAAMTSRI